MANPDIKLLIGPKGGASPSGASAVEIRQALQTALSGKNGVKANVRLASNAANNLREEIQKALNANGGIEIKIKGQIAGAVSKAASGTEKQQELSYTQAVSKALGEQNRLQQNIASETAKTAEASKRAADATRKKAESDKISAISIRSSAALNVQNFNKYLQGVSAKGLMDYAEQINHIRELYRLAEKNGVKESLQAADSAARQLKATFKDLGYEGGNVFTYIQNKVKSFMVYLVSSKLTNALIKGVRDGVTAVKDLNAEMTQLRIVTGASQAQMDKFLDSAISKAKNVGSSVTDMLNSTTVYARLGYSMDESADLAEYTAMLQNVGDIDVESAQNAITAIVKAYDVGANQIETTMDKMVTVGNNFPISVSQLAEGMNNAGSALSAAGNSFDQSLALLAAANTTVQNISKSSTGLRTIAARIRNTKTELDDLGEAMTDAEYDNLVQSLTKANVSLTGANGELRSTYDILQGIAKVWGKMGKNDQAALAETLAGTRQQNIFYSLINQFNEASNAMNAMTSSAGAMSAANSVYMESVGAKADRMHASFQELASTLLDSDILGWLYDFGNAALNAVSAFDAWPAKIALVAAGLPTLIGLFRELRNMPLITSIGDSFKDLAHLPMMLSSFGTALSTISGTTNITRSTLMGLVGDFKNLSVQQIAQIALSGKMSKADLFAALQAAGLTREERKLIAARLEEAGATGASTAATVTDTAAKGANQIATFSLTKSVKGLWAILKAHPILLLIGAVFGLVKAFNWLDDTFAITQGAQIKKTQKLQEEYTTLQGDVQDVEGKLKNVQDRIDELNRMDSPSFTDEDELKRLEKENELLKDQLSYKQQLAEEKAKETNESLQKQYDNQFGSGSYGQYESINKTIQSTDEVGNVIFIGADITGEQRMDELIARAKELKAISKDSWTQENQDELDAINSELEAMAHRMSDLAGQVQENDGVGKELYNTFYDLWDLLIRASQGDFWLNSSTEAFDKIWNDSKFSKAKAGLSSLAEQGELTAEALASPEYADFVSALVQSGIACDDAGFHYTDVANHIVALSKAAKEEGAAGANSLKAALAGLSDETTVLLDAMGKLGEGSAAFDKWIGSDDNLKSLLDKFPNLRDELEAYNSALVAGEDPQKAFIELQRAMNAALRDFNADQVYDGVNDVVDAFNDYGAGSNQVLQAVQNLDKYIPGLTNQLYSQDNAFSSLNGTTELTAEAFYEYCAAAIEAERISREIDISNLTTDLSELAAMAMTAGHSMKEAMGLAKDEAYNRSGESFGIDDSMAKLTEWYETSRANLEGARNRWRRGQSSKKSSGSEVYVPDVDPLYQYLQTVEDINDELDRIDLDEKLLDEDDFEGKNKLIEDRIAKLEDLKTALHELNNARDVEIEADVKKLNGYGDFQATYDKESGQALINNMDTLKGLTGDTAKAAEELISAIENGSKAALSTSKEYMEALIEQNSLLKEQKELQDQKAEEQADDELERIKNRITRLQNRQDVFATNIDHQNVMHDLGEEKQAYQEMIDLAVRRGAELRAAGAENDDPALAKWSQTYFEGLKGMRDTNRKMVDEILKPYDEFISNADTYSWWDNLDDTKADVLSEKLAKIHNMYKTGLIPDAEMYKELVNETAEALYKEQLDAIDQTIEYTEELIKKEHELREEELEEQKRDYKAIVDAKKESLRASKEEADYQKSVAEKVKAISKLQQQINTLSLSDDRRDVAERKKLEEELAQLQGELSDTQADHSLSAQEDALDKSYEAFEKEKDDEIKVVKAEVDTVGKVYALAIERINSGWDDLYKDLAEWNRNYADGIKGEDGLEGAWKTAKSAASEYFDVLDARQGLEKKYVSASGGNMAVGDTDVYKDKYGLDWDTHKTVQEKANQMRSNSNAWHAANSAGNTYLADTYVSKNEDLVKEIEGLIKKKLYRDHNGVWHIDDGQGTQLYKVYHKGGIVGSNEEFAKVEKGELVVPKDQVKPTMMMLEWGNSLASKMKGLFSKDGFVASTLTDAIKGAPLSPAAGAIVNNNAPSFAPNIQVEVKYDGSASSADAKRFGENITAGIVEAFRRNGIGTGANQLGVTI